MQYIYKFTNKTNGKVYIGRTDDFNRRMAEHRAMVKGGRGHSLYDAIRKYGWDTFSIEIIDQAETFIEIMAKELEYIVKHDSVRTGYNSTENTDQGGNPWAGREDSEEFKQYREYMSKRMQGDSNGMYGAIHTEESKNKMKEKAKGRFTLPWYIQKYGEELGTQKYNDRCQALRNRNYNKFKDPSTGRFHKSMGE
jgi:group I intron endonuclease